jgi:hypothetical protein
MNTTNDIDELAEKEARLVRRELLRASRSLVPGLCVRYDELTSDDARRKFYRANRENLQVGGLLQICFESGKAISMRARTELKARESGSLQSHGSIDGN